MLKFRLDIKNQKIDLLPEGTHSPAVWGVLRVRTWTARRPPACIHSNSELHNTGKAGDAHLLDFIPHYAWSQQPWCWLVKDAKRDGDTKDFTGRSAV